MEGDSVEVYDPHRNCWSFLASMNQQRAGTTQRIQYIIFIYIFKKGVML